MMELSVVDAEARQSKLDKQRDLLIKKRKQKHAHQVLSLHEKSLKAAVGTAPRSPKTTKHSERTVANDFEQNNYAYDGPQSYNLGNPDLLETPSVQVLRIARNSPQDSNSQTNHNSKSPEPAPANPSRPRARPSPKPAVMRFSEEPAKQAFHSPIRPMKLPLPASVTDADDQQHLFAADERDRIGFPDTDSRRVSPRSRDTRRNSAPRRPQPPRTNNLVNSKLDESTKPNCVSSSLVQEFTLPSDSSPSWVDDNSQPSDTVSRSTSTIPNSSPCLRLRKNSNQKNGQQKKNSRKGHLKKTRSDELGEVEEALTSASDTHVAVGDKIRHKSSPLVVSSGERPNGEGGFGDVPLDLQFRNKVSCRLETEANSSVRLPKSAGAAHSRLQRRRPRHKADEEKNELPKAEGKEEYRSLPDVPNCFQTVTPNLEDHFLAKSTSGCETLERKQDRQQAQLMPDLPQESVSRKTKTTPPSMQTSVEADFPCKHKSEEENNDINHTSTTLGPPDYDKVERPRKVSREEKTSPGAPLEDISTERAVSNATNLIGENEANSTIPENIVEDHVTECETQRDSNGTEDPIKIIESEPVSSLSADTVTMPEELSVTTTKRHRQGGLGPEPLQLKLNLPDAVYNAKKTDAFEPEDDIEAFVVRPAPKGTRVRCRISRDKRGVDRGFFPTYFLHLERDDGRRFFLLAARRRHRSTTSNYVISFDATDLSRSSCRLAGKLRANFVGTHFTVYNVPSTQILQGRMTERSESETVATPGSRSMLSGSIPPSPREAREVAAIIYDPNILGFKGPRKMTVIIPKMDEDGHMMNIYSDNDSCLLLDQWRKKKTYAIMELRNKTPAWNEDTQSYVLNFHGRVTQASVKNFQIVPKADEHTVLMQFGRVSEDIFNMDFEYPLCALQAFGIALSSFDGKLACE